MPKPPVPRPPAGSAPRAAGEPVPKAPEQIETEPPGATRANAGAQGRPRAPKGRQGVCFERLVGLVFLFWYLLFVFAWPFWESE